MKRLSHILTVVGLGTCLLAGLGNALAQPQDKGGDRGRGGPGGFDPARMQEFQQRMMERVKEQLEVTNDAEWKVIEPLVTKVFEARREAATSGMRGMFGRGPGGPGGDRGGDSGRSMFGQPSPEAQALNKAIESKASKDELKSAMAKHREARKAKEAAMKEAQENLRKVLSLRQEAICVANGWLD